MFQYVVSLTHSVQVSVFLRGFLVIFVLVQSCVLAVYECSSEAVER